MYNEGEYICWGIKIFKLWVIYTIVKNIDRCGNQFYRSRWAWGVGVGISFAGQGGVGQQNIDNPQAIKQYQVNYHKSKMQKEEPRWLIAPPDKNLRVPFLKGVPLKALENEKMEYEVETEKGKMRMIVEVKSTFQRSKGELYDDMCEMNVLNQPEILRNLIERYGKDEIFTYIGPTLIVINPYKFIPRHFNDKLIGEVRDAVLTRNTKAVPPHVYMIAGRAYQGLITGECKQAIVISGESGAGKTESTKYCMKMITSLSHRESHSIEKKILACNPLLEAFGNSKTVRNDNSSRFGKYVQIFFGKDNTICGANIISYLLEKSRVVSVSANERTFHAFYALTSSKEYHAKEPAHYAFLKQSGMYKAANIDDAEYFKEINRSMVEIGFTQAEINKIWELVWCILEFGNLGFRDEKHQANENECCDLEGKCDLTRISKVLETKEEELKRVLLQEKKIMHKDVCFKPYSKAGCVGNRNTICKAIYNAMFEFIIYKIQKALNPTTTQKLNSINLLDIFGFENFGDNSLEQLCINFTNQKLLKQYNKYVFENEMVILKEDGLEKEIENIRPPTNDDVISLLSSELSLFSIINDNTPNAQFKDEDMISGFQRKFNKSKLMRFDLLKKNNFTIIHSQCEVTYNIDGFKFKNQDKINQDIEDIYKKLFENENKNQAGKTLLKKFQKEIEDLVTELSSASNHFVRCIKPNEQKKANTVDAVYMLTQVRYLGVFETIQIRQKTFPSRKLYSDFIKTFQPIFKDVKGREEKDLVNKIMAQIKAKERDYLLGTKRIYMNKEIEDKLNKELYNFFKVKNEMAGKIQKMFKKYKIRRTLTKLARRSRLLKKIFAKTIIRELALRYFNKCSEKMRQKEEQLRLEKEKERKILEQKLKVEKQQEQKLRIAKQNKKVIKLQALQPKPIDNSIVDKTNVSLKGMFGQQTSQGDMSMIVQSEEKTYKRLQRSKPKEQEQGQFNQSFLNEKSIYITDKPELVFQHTLQIDLYEGKEGNFDKLQRILSQQYKLEVTGNEEQFFSPNSQDCNFQIEQAPADLLNKIIHFNVQEFFKRVLRKRTNFIGITKDYKDILIAKNRPLNKSITLMSEVDEDKALKVFKVIIRIGEEVKLDNVFRLIENMITLCQSTSQQLKNEVFLQLIKQSYTSHQLAAIRIFQSLAVFLHIYIPDQDFLMAILYLFNKRLHDGKSSEKEEDYLRYLFKKMLRKIQNPPVIGYMPIKYQMMALMCKRQISIPVYLPIGNSILIRVQSYETFADIKEKVIEEFGIDSGRIKPEMFRFFQIVNFQNEELEQSPLNENQIVWDIMTYWQLAKEKYKEANSPPPAFFLMLKIVYCFQVLSDDEQAIQLCFAQCYFDYFIGRIRLQFDYMAALAACVKKIKLPNRPQHQILGSYPIWMAKKYDKKELVAAMVDNIRQMEAQGLSLMEMKYRFLQICDKCSLAMAVAIPTEQPVKLYLKPKKVYLTEKSQIREEFAMKNIVKWAIDKEKFVFDVKASAKGSNHSASSSQVIFTEYANICSQFLSDLPKLLKKKMEKH